MILSTLNSTLNTLVTTGGTAVSGMTSTSLESLGDSMGDEAQSTAVSFTTSGTSTSLSLPILSIPDQIELDETRNYTEAMTIEEQRDFIDLLDRKLARIENETDLIDEMGSINEVQSAKVYIKK